jgi:hypothetical protein
MTYHRTAGKGGTRNAKAEPLPNFNKTQGSGTVRKGKMLPNAAPSSGNFPPKKRR